MKTFLERYEAGEHVAVWDELVALGQGVRHELYYADAVAVATETMRRARHNVETLIQRLDSMGYRFLDQVSSAEDQLSRLDVMEQLSAQIEARFGGGTGPPNVHTAQMLESMRAMQAKVAPMMEKAAAKAAQAAATKRKSPLEDSQVFDPPDKKTPRLIARLEKIAGGPLPISLRAWYEQVGGVSLMGSHSVINTADFSNRSVLTQFQSIGVPQAAPRPLEPYAPDPLVIMPIEELLAQSEEDEDGEGSGNELQIVISPDDLHKANVSGDAYYLKLPDARADFQFDDWHHTTFVRYLRITFQWGGFPGWERSMNPPRKEIAELSEGLLPL